MRMTGEGGWQVVKGVDASAGRTVGLWRRRGTQSDKTGWGGCLEGYTQQSDMMAVKYSCWRVR